MLILNKIADVVFIFVIDYRSSFVHFLIIVFQRNFGHIRSPYYGIIQTSGDATIYLASDFQDPPELIQELVKKYDEGNDIVHTKRTKRLGESKIKLLLTRLAYLIIHYFSDINLPIEAGDYKLISRRAMDNILKHDIWWEAEKCLQYGLVDEII